MLTDVAIRIRQRIPGDFKYTYNIDLDGEGINLSGQVIVTQVDTRVQGLIEKSYPREFQDHRDPIFYAIDAVGKYFQDQFLAPPTHETESTNYNHHSYSYPAGYC